MTRDTEDNLFLSMLGYFMLVVVCGVLAVLATGCGTTKPNRIGSPDSCDVCHH